MAKRYHVSDAEVSLLYWQAEIAFGEEALKKVLSRSPWKERFFDIAERAHSDDVQIMQAANGTVLPGEFLYEVAGIEECENDFFADWDGIRLHSAPHSPSS